MADKPGSYKGTPKVSRHTMVMRRARDDDARKVAERDDDAVVIHDGGASARLTARGAHTQRSSAPESRRERTVSGRRVTVEHEGSVSGRYSTRLSGAHSVRVAGGDTIIRYKSGDMVIKRGARRASLRKQAIWLYALGYLVLFGSYVFFLFTGTTAITAEEFIRKAFSMRHSAEVIDLERAALEAMRGNRTPAEIRMAQTLRFYDEEKDTIHVEKGDRLTLLTAAKLGHAILEDQKRPPEKREFRESFQIYKETYLAGVNWPYLMTVYNALGFFLLLLLFLWRPIMHYLGTQGKKTAVALRNSRDAQQEAAEYREKYRALAGEIDDKGEALRGQVRERTDADRDEMLLAARRTAEDIAGGVTAALENEERDLAGRIGADAATAACEQARRILQERLGQAEHDVAIEELIADIAGMKLESAPA